MLGVVETDVGFVGIVVPEPGTTAGVVVFSLGVNSIADGFSQLAGANKGHGYNILSESSAKEVMKGLLKLLKHGVKY